MTPRSRVPIVRTEETQRIIDLMSWDMLGGQAPWPMTNVRNLALSQTVRGAGVPDQEGRAMNEDVFAGCEWLSWLD